MNSLFWILLLVGGAMVLWPFLAAVTTGTAVTLWILGVLMLLGAVYVAATRAGRSAEPAYETTTGSTDALRRDRRRGYGR